MAFVNLSWPYSGLLQWRPERQHTMEDQVLLRRGEGQSAPGDPVTRRDGPLSSLTIILKHDS